MIPIWDELEIIRPFGKIIGIAADTDPKEDHVVFVSDRNSLKRLADSSKTIALTILDESLKGSDLKNSKGLAFSKSFNLIFTQTSKYFYDLEFKDLISTKDERELSKIESEVGKDVFIGRDVFIGKNVKINPGVVIMSKVEIADDVEIFSNAVIYPKVKIGKSSVIGSGAVIGSDGFGFKMVKGEHLRLWHTGGVIIGSNVKVGTLSLIDTGTFSPTIVGDGTIIEDLVQVGHNSKIGKNCFMGTRSGLAGSSTLEDNVVMDVLSGVIMGASIGSDSRLHFAATAIKDYPRGSQLSGYPAIPTDKWELGQRKLQELLSE